MDFYIDSLTMFEGQYVDLVFYSDFKLAGVKNDLFLRWERKDDYTIRVYGLLGVLSKEEPYYITILKDPDEKNGEDVNIKVYVQKYDGIPFDSLLNG